MQGTLDAFIEEIDQVQGILYSAYRELLFGTSEGEKKLEDIHRAAHTLASSSATVGLKNTSMLMKQLEALTSTYKNIHELPSFHALINEVMGYLQKLRANLVAGESEDGLDVKSLMGGIAFIAKIAPTMARRYKIHVLFEESYELKNIRAFMVLKDLRDHVEFVKLNPDITKNQKANLNKGLEMEIVTNKSPKELHDIISSVLEVVGVKIFLEMKKVPATYFRGVFALSDQDIRVTEFVT